MCAPTERPTGSKQSPLGSRLGLPGTNKKKVGKKLGFKLVLCCCLLVGCPWCCGTVGFSLLFCSVSYSYYLLLYTINIFYTAAAGLFASPPPNPLSFLFRCWELASFRSTDQSTAIFNVFSHFPIFFPPILISSSIFAAAGGWSIAFAGGELPMNGFASFFFFFC